MLLRSATLSLVVCLLAGCGYSLGYQAPPGARTIAVPIFQNATVGLRRELEYDLTLLVRREIQSRTDLTLADSESADLVLRGTIREFREDIVVEGQRDRKEESNVRAIVDVVLEDYLNGVKYPRRVRDDQPFSPRQGEDFADGRRRALENLAERIVASIEYWAEPPAVSDGAASSADGSAKGIDDRE